MNFISRYLARARAQQLIEIWENGAKQDIQMEINAWPLEGRLVADSKSAEKAMLQALLDKVESRIVAHAVMQSMNPQRGNKPPAPFIDKA